MKINPFYSLLLLLFSLSLQAQEEEPYFVFEDYDWEEEQAPFTGELDDSTAALILKEKHLFNYYYHEEEERLVMDRLFHQRIYINSTRALEEYNRRYVPTGAGSELLKFRARAITGTKVTEIGEDDIQTGQLEDSEAEYNYFAFEGLEVGSEIEFYYINRLSPNTDGLMINYQEEYEIKELEIDVVTPWGLIFDSKVYNLPDSVMNDTVLEQENRLYIRTSVPAYEEESVSPSDALMGRVIFKLDRNLYTGDRDITSYNYTAQNVVSFLTSELDRKGEKVIKKEAKAAQEYLLEEEPDFTTAQRVEHYIKDNYSYYNVGAAELRDLDFIRDRKVFNNVGGTRLYCGIYDFLEIPYQIVYTCNRNQLFFDSEFEADNFLEEMLIYVPEDDLYIDISESMSRNGVLNFNYTGTKALFIDKEMLADEYVAITEVKEIPYHPSIFTSDTIIAKVVFGPDLLDNKVEIYRAMTGFSARSYQGIFELIDDEDDLKEFKETLISYIDDEGEVEDLEVENAMARYVGYKPLQANGSLTDIRFLENAGQDLLLNVGKLIGPQMAMYDEDSVRNHDIYNQYAHKYYRTIEFEIPEGYTLVDPEKLVFDEKLMIDGETKALFTSNFSKEGKKVVVTIEEWYEDKIYPKELFQEYLKVINAAADFNKVSVLLEKEA